MSTDVDKGYLTYSVHRDIYRKWIMGFCIGLSAIIITAIINNTDKSLPFRSSIRPLFISLAIAAAAQILLTLINKFCMLSVHFVDDKPYLRRSYKSYKDKFPWPLYRFYLISDWFWIDIALDSVSLTAIGFSIYYALNLFIPGCPDVPETGTP